MLRTILTGAGVWVVGCVLVVAFMWAASVRRRWSDQHRSDRHPARQLGDVISIERARRHRTRPVGGDAS